MVVEPHDLKITEATPALAVGVALFMRGTIDAAPQVKLIFGEF